MGKWTREERRDESSWTRARMPLLPLPPPPEADPLPLGRDMMSWLTAGFQGQDRVLQVNIGDAPFLRRVVEMLEGPQVEENQCERDVEPASAFLFSRGIG